MKIHIHTDFIFLGGGAFEFWCLTTQELAVPPADDQSRLDTYLNYDFFNRNLDTCSVVIGHQ